MEKRIKTTKIAPGAWPSRIRPCGKVAGPAGIIRRSIRRGDKMIRERMGAAGFTLGALSAPIALLASGACGASCGACVLGAPIVFGAVLLTNRRSRIKESTPVETDDIESIEEESDD
jgi:hypothetical protein